MTQLKVLVVGASIAGPSTAYWLAKTGAHVTVIERFPQLRTGGQAIDIRTAGVTVMQKIPGLEAAVSAKKSPLEGISFVRKNGQPYGVLRSTGNPEQQSLVSEYEVFRGDLNRILFDMTKDNPNVQYIFGEQIASMQQSESGEGPIKVEFANGSATSDYDLVVACDGATSRTRAMGLACAVRDHITPHNLWAAYFSVQGDLLNGSKIGQALTAPGGRFLSIGPDQPSKTLVTLMAIYPKDGSDVTLPFREAAKQGDDALRRFVAHHYKDVGWVTEKVMQGMMETDDFYASEIVQVRSPTLYKGRFALVGDAGYAPGFTGFGTSLAMTGAYVLAGEIGKHKGDLAAGLKGYEEQMRPIITEMQKVPPFLPGIVAPQSAWAIWLRNHIFAFITWTGIIEFAQKYLGGAFTNSSQYPLPEYQWVS
ncbi:hypothetical protein MMC25_001632 [Agyrium rufum]|nr:hypothetical protein [Agyrium rufum]